MPNRIEQAPDVETKVLDDIWDDVDDLEDDMFGDEEDSDLDEEELSLSGFDPNQPRADNGRWSESADTGGGSGGVEMRTMADGTKRPLGQRKPKPVAVKPKPVAPKLETPEEYRTRQLKELDELAGNLKPFGTKRKSAKQNIADKVVDKIADYLEPHSDKIAVTAAVLEAVGSVMQSMGLSNLGLSNYDPNQLRDNKGQWTDGSNADSLTKYTNQKGEWTAERTKLHDSIVAKHLAQAKTKPTEPVYVIFGGGSAAGKSNLSRHLSAGELPQDKVHIDTDEIKKDLPEYGEMLSKKDSRAAAYTHEESSYLGKRIVKEALAAGHNVILDGTGNVSLESLTKKAAQARQAGHKVIGVYATVPTNVAEKRNLDRAERTGRLVVPTYLRSTHAAVSRILPQAMADDTFDKVQLFDTQQGVKLIASKTKGFPQVIHDNDLYQAFLDKAKK